MASFRLCENKRRNGTKLTVNTRVTFEIITLCEKTLAVIRRSGGADEES